MDPVDRMIIEESPESAKHLLVIDSPELADAASDVAGRVSIYCDDRRDADQVPRSLLIEALDAATLEGVDLVWMRLPKALAALDEYAERISAHALPGVHLVAAGRTKHMTLSMNDVLGKHFKAVSASLGRNKSRALHAIGATPTELTWPRENLHPELSLGVIAHGAVFATNKVDDGTRLLAERCADLHGNDLLDLGCGSGILATLLARANPEATVHGVDTSLAAVDSTRITSGANGRHVTVHWAWNLNDWPADSLDVIVCNPPFHRGVAKDSEPALEMFTEAGRLLRPGGEFWCVYNSHLPWKARLTASIGPTTVDFQNPFYTVTRSIAR
ncbi:class I SAM-dependent methyltransferase [Propionibacterium freudenreichii]